MHITPIFGEIPKNGCPNDQHTVARMIRLTVVVSQLCTMERERHLFSGKQMENGVEQVYDYILWTVIER
jgi:hypothetical protein